MNRLMLATIAVCMFPAGSATAQPPTEEQVDQFLERLEENRERLNLSPEQAEAMEELAEELSTASVAILRDHGIEPGAPWPALNSETILGLRDAMAELNEQHEAALAEILTAEQLETWQEIQAEALEEIQPENPR